MKEKHSAEVPTLICAKNARSRWKTSCYQEIRKESLEFPSLFTCPHLPLLPVSARVWRAVSESAHVEFHSSDLKDSSEEFHVQDL